MKNKVWPDSTYDKKKLAARQQKWKEKYFERPKNCERKPFVGRK